MMTEHKEQYETPEYNNDDKARLDALANIFGSVHEQLETLLPANNESITAIDKLKTAHMWARKSIERGADALPVKEEVAENTTTESVEQQSETAVGGKHDATQPEVTPETTDVQPEAVGASV